MTSEPMTKLTPVTQRIEEVSGIHSRNETLLVAFGIILITTLLICTGIAANHLRGQALDTTESEPRADRRAPGRIGTAYIPMPRMPGSLRSPPVSNRRRTRRHCAVRWARRKSLCWPLPR